MVTLSALNIYPVKSAAGTGLSNAHVAPRGLQYDRRWMVVDAKGRFMTQRKHPRMALIWVTLGDQLQLEVPGQPPLVLPLMPTEQTDLSVEVWGDLCTAWSMGATAAEWLSQFLEVPCRLVYMPDQAQRATAHGKLGPDKLVSFADAYPFLLISEASLSDLNGRLAKPIPMNRFRPNLVVTDCSAFAEDTWAKIRIGDVVFSVEKGCDRCSIPGVDQATGVADKEPLPTLATYRRWQGKIWFGQNLVQENLGELHVGDPVEILAYKETAAH
ncbi:MAG: MOSC N-terminal beta barrel domain-containing protein [Cyanobacteria bacterium J06632_22]